MKRREIIISLTLAILATIFINAYTFLDFRKPIYEPDIKTEYVKPFYRFGEIYETIFLDDF